MTNEQYDVFLSYNSADKNAVEAIALQLRDEARLRPWLNEWNLIPGAPRLAQIEQALGISKTVAVFFGPAGVGRWHDEEKQLALICNKPVIPVLLPGTSTLEVTGFLKLRTWVDLGREHGFERLRAGIEGKAPALFIALHPGTIRSAALEGIPPMVAPTRLPHSTTQLFGRDEELAALDAAWAARDDNETNVITLVAWGGVGKTSLMFEWMNRMARDEWRGARAVFDWSFYSQGVREHGAPSAEQFVQHALRFFGDEAMASSPASAWDKGARLAELIGQQRTLLILDGLEPLQHPPGHEGITPGMLTDPAMQALLRGLARHNPGLCVVTTREAIQDLAGFGPSVRHWSLERLSKQAGAALLEFLLRDKSCGRRPIESPTTELEAICEAFDGHALTLHLLGRYIRRRQWDPRRWQEIPLGKADSKAKDGHAFRVIGAYERWLSGEDGTEREGLRLLAVLRLLGLFDRPAAPGCIGALCSNPEIEGLTGPLVELDDEDWAFVLDDLEELGLISTTVYEPTSFTGYSEQQADLLSGKTTGSPTSVQMPGWSKLSKSLDAHPLIREYFGRQLAKNETAWKQAHRRLFEHLCQSTPYWPEGLPSLQPLYQAIAHGCQADEHSRAQYEVYRNRILRGESRGGFYSTSRLGAFMSDLGALVWFFDKLWDRVTPRLPQPTQAWLLNEAAFRLRILGRLGESDTPTRISLQFAVDRREWKTAAIRASNLVAWELLRGNVTNAIEVGKKSVEYADESHDERQRISRRTTYAEALYQANLVTEARRQFEYAEDRESRLEPGHHKYLCSMEGTRYCDLLLNDAERWAWRVTLASSEHRPIKSTDFPWSTTRELYGDMHRTCHEVLSRAECVHEVEVLNNRLLDLGLGDLLMSRVWLYRALFSSVSWPGHPESTPAKTHPTALDNSFRHVDAAIDGLRRANRADHLTRALLTRAWLRRIRVDTDAAVDLDEAEEIAIRGGPMLIYLADVRLTRARLLRDRTELDRARVLLDDIRARGYRRHDGMLADAEAVAVGWPQ